MSKTAKEFSLLRDEKFIQIVDDQQGLTALTNEGRIAYRPHFGNYSGYWYEVKMPRGCDE
jgi:hypothetical protein